MKTEDGKIKEASYTELFQIWKDQEFDKTYSFAEYVSAIKAAGGIVLEDQP